MNELQKLIEKWDEQIALHRRVCDDPLMYTKEDRLKNAHYAQAICAVVADLKKLTIPAVVGRSEQLKGFVDWWHGLSQEELAWYEGRYVEVFLSL